MTLTGALRATALVVVAIATFALSGRAPGRAIALAVDLVCRDQARRPLVTPNGLGSSWDLPGTRAGLAGTGAPSVPPALIKRYTALHYQVLATQAAHERRLGNLERVEHGDEHPRAPGPQGGKRQDG